MIILEKNGDIVEYLKKRNIVKQYLKAKKNILNNNFKTVNLKKRQPQSESIWYFRISKKYRALAEKVGDKLYVFKISDHQ
jgi:ribosomal protein S19E (S16A)